MSTEDHKEPSKASQLEDAMTKQLRQQRNPFLRPVFTVAAIGALFMIFGFIVQMMADTEKSEEVPAPIEKPQETHLTVHGECICISCTLHLSTQHHRAIRYRGDGNEEKIILLREHPDMDMNTNYFCGGPTPCLVEGDIPTNGLRILTATAFRAYPNE
jgi:hypothetical protein